MQHRLHVRRTAPCSTLLVPCAPITPSLSPALSSVRSKVFSNCQHHHHLSHPRSAADVVPLLPTAGRHQREPPRRTSSHRTSCLSVCLHEPSQGAPPSEHSDERPPSSSTAGHYTTGGPLWSSSGLVSASMITTSARSTSASMQTLASTPPMAPHWRAPSARPHRHGERYSNEPLPSPTPQIGPPPCRGVPQPPCSLPLATGHRNR
jgi:hypothetical protein